MTANICQLNKKPIFRSFCSMLIFSYTKIKLIFMCSVISQYYFDVCLIIFVYKASLKTYFKIQEFADDTHMAKKKMWRQVTNSVLGVYGGYQRIQLHFSVKLVKANMPAYVSFFENISPIKRVRLFKYQMFFVKTLSPLNILSNDGIFSTASKYI